MAILGPALVLGDVSPEVEAQAYASREEVQSEKNTVEQHTDKRETITHHWKITKTRTTEGDFVTTTENNDDREKAGRTKRRDVSSWCCSCFGRAKPK